jgi:hypothetical protein
LSLELLLPLCRRKTGHADDAPANAGHFESPLRHPRQGGTHFAIDAEDKEIAVKSAQSIGHSFAGFTQQVFQVFGGGNGS